MCPVCGYNLRDQEHSTCPECGCSIELRIGSADLRMGPWIASLCGTAIGLGGGTLTSTILTIGLVIGGSPPFEFFLFILAVYGSTTAFACGALALYRERRRFWKMPRQRQVTLAITICTVVGLAGIGLLVWMFMFI